MILHLLDLLWSNESCWNRVSADQYNLTVSLKDRPIEVDYFLKLPADKLLVFKMISGSSLIFFFNCIRNKFKILISSWSRTPKFSYCRHWKQLLLTFDSPWSRSTSNFYALIGQNLTGEFMQKIYVASGNLFTLTAEADRVLCHLEMFSIVFFHWMYSCFQDSSVIPGWFVYWVLVEKCTAFRCCSLTL